MSDAATRRIPLSRGLFALVDDCDFEWASQFKWHARQSSAGTPRFYAQRNVLLPSGKRSMRYMHRELLGALPGQEVDHKDRDRLNNRRDNLRFCSRSQNNANSGKRRNAVSSRFKGVTWESRRKHWVAQIQVRGKHFFLGSFASEKRAAAAYATAAQNHFGEYARTA